MLNTHMIAPIRLKLGEMCTTCIQSITLFIYLFSCCWRTNERGWTGKPWRRDKEKPGFSIGESGGLLCKLRF